VPHRLSEMRWTTNDLRGEELIVEIAYWILAGSRRAFSISVKATTDPGIGCCRKTAVIPARYWDEKP
jgi:hypothetical protein